MRLPLVLTVAFTFALAGIMSLIAAALTANVIEDTSQSSVTAALDKHGLEWTEVYAEGLNVFITGTAPTEAERFMAMSTAGSVVDAARVIDNMNVEATAALAPPKFSIEILRNEAGISLIGLIPQDSDRRAVLNKVRRLAGGEEQLADFMETADYPVPTGWTDAMEFALDALEDLPQSKISVEAGYVEVTAMTDSAEAQFKTEMKLLEEIPSGVELALDISAPRPVITPFSMRATLSEGVLRFDSCSADTIETRRAILDAAETLGLAENSDCRIGLGVPSPNWADATITSLQALSEIGGGSVTMSDADISLVAIEGTDEGLFDRVVSETEKALPEVFALHSVLPVIQEDGESTVTEFIATLSPEGLMQMRGRLGSELASITVGSYAKARFGSENVYDATRGAEDVPPNWPNRVMAGLDALSALHHGSVTVTPQIIEVSGQSGKEDVGTTISQLLSQRLGEGEQFAMDVSYNEALDPLALIPTPEECIAQIQQVQSEVKITFEPGSGDLQSSARPVIDALAAILEDCGELPLEIQGHTDSQGRESMNLALSQNRAQSVLAALRDRRILTGAIRAQGYGEANPIADNGTEEGREANRRIEFVLIQPDQETEETVEETSETETETSAENTEAAAENSEETLETTEESVEEASDADTSAAEETQDEQN